jgi:hypothetical protein
MLRKIPLLHASTTVPSWSYHGLIMVSSWSVHGLIMVLSWSVHGLFMLPEQRSHVSVKKAWRRLGEE